MHLYHEIIEIGPGYHRAIAVCRPVGATPMPEEHAAALRREGLQAVSRRDQLYFTRIDDGNAYIWHLIPSPMRAFERIFQ